MELSKDEIIMLHKSITIMNAICPSGCGMGDISDCDDGCEVCWEIALDSKMEELGE